MRVISGTQAWLAGLPGIFAAGRIRGGAARPTAALGLALLGGVAAWAIYRLGMAFVWSPWDRRTKAAFAAAAAEHQPRSTGGGDSRPNLERGQTLSLPVNVAAAVDLERRAGDHLGFG